MVFFVNKVKEKPKMENETIVSVMKRYELKYRLSKDQLAFFISKIKGHMQVDKYGLTSIASIYFDTPDFRLINKSIEKPKYKEKVRLRGYGLAKPGKPVFLEVKRKCEGVVYKRRISLSEEDAYELILNKKAKGNDQISKELVAFMEKYPNLEAKYLIIYEREAYYQEGTDLRVTLDMNPRYRVSDLNLHTSLDGTPLLEDGGAILEIKVQHSLPLWLVAILSEGKIYKTSFSKVGTAHQKEMAKLIERKVHVFSESKYMVKGEKKYGFAV